VSPAAKSVEPALPAVVKGKCSLCHGERGEGTGEAFPRLAGQNEAYLVKELNDFLSGQRVGMMTRMAKGLMPEEIAVVAHYYASQPGVTPATPPSELATVGKYLYQHGNTYSGLPACKDCHGSSAHGTPHLPRLAGQHAAYLERQIKDFITRKRTNDNEVMHSVAEKATAFETRALAEYLASLP
jgi:cytochrome c553